MFRSYMACGSNRAAGCGVNEAGAGVDTGSAREGVCGEAVKHGPKKSEIF